MELESSVGPGWVVQRFEKSLVEVEQLVENSVRLELVIKKVDGLCAVWTVPTSQEVLVCMSVRQRHQGVMDG